MPKEDQGGSGHPFGDDRHRSFDEAKQRLVAAIDKVREMFPNLRLENLFMREIEGRRTCNALRSSCYNGVLQQLVERILNELESFQVDALADVPIGERNICKESTSLTAVTVHLPIAENPLNRAEQKMINRKIPLEKTYEFFDFLLKQFQKANDDKECQNVKHVGCDCEQFLQFKFPYVRSVSVKLIFRGMVEKNHNPYLAALACFCINYNLLNRPQLKDLRARFFSKIKAVDWPAICKHVTHPYVDNRMRTHQKKKHRWAEVTPFAIKYEEFEKEIKEKFPFLFKKDGAFEENFLELADPGDVFECINCCEEFPKRFNILCQPRAGTKTEGIARHALCFCCMKNLADATSNATPFAEDGLGLICVIRNCNNTLPLHDIQRYLSRNVRKMLHDRMLNIVLSTAKIQNLEKCKKCGYPAICDCPKTVNKVFACPKCGYKHCRLCEVEWDDHFGKKCEEIPMKVRVNNLRRRIDERLIRRCPNCTIPYLKGEACNCVACPCGISNCYLCRTTGVNHAHFCNCQRSKKDETNEICPNCGRKCRLFEDSKKWDDRIIAEVKSEADPTVLRAFEEEERGSAIGEIQAHTNNDFMRMFIERNIKAPTVKKRNHEESPLPPAHWQIYHNPASQQQRR